MKKYAIPVLSIALNIVLLLFVKNLSGQVSDLQRQVRSLESDMDRKITSEVGALRNDLEKDARLYESYELQPTGLDSTTQSLLADFDLQLKQWSADTAVTLFVGDKTVSLMAGEPGHFTAPLSLPIAQSGEVLLNIDITTNGVTTREELSRMMVGRDVEFVVHKEPAKPGKTILEVEDLTVASKTHSNNAVKGVSFTVRAGEIVCIAGIDGNGQTELV